MYDAADWYELLGRDLLSLPFGCKRVNGKTACQRVGFECHLYAVWKVGEQFAGRGRLWLQRVGDFQLAVETEIEFVRKIEISLVVTVPCIREHDRDVGGGIVLIQLLRFADVFVILHTSVLEHLQMIDIGVCVNVVSLSSVIAVEGGSKGTGCRIHEVATTVKIINLEAQTGILVDIRGEIGTNAVLTVNLTTHGVVGQIGNGTERIGKAELMQAATEIAEGAQEKELV